MVRSPAETSAWTARPSASAVDDAGLQPEDVDEEVVRLVGALVDEDRDGAACGEICHGRDGTTGPTGRSWTSGT
jgi:hypothetical protein